MHRQNRIFQYEDADGRNKGHWDKLGKKLDNWVFTKSEYVQTEAGPDVSIKNQL